MRKYSRPHLSASSVRWVLSYTEAQLGLNPVLMLGSTGQGSHQTEDTKVFSACSESKNKNHSHTQRQVFLQFHGILLGMEEELASAHGAVSCGEYSAYAQKMMLMQQTLHLQLDLINSELVL